MSDNQTYSVGQLAQIASILEVWARKPGNVHRKADFDDCTYLDFVLSAQAIGAPIDRVGERGVGLTILDALLATKKVVTTNTNLGILLLIVPMAAVPRGVELREGIRDVLAKTTIEDARHVYEAIRLANPGGLGQVAEHDVADPPRITLVEAMRAAESRDTIALQYANNYQDIFNIGLPTLKDAIEAGWPLETSIVATALIWLVDRPDSLIARKLGIDEAWDVKLYSEKIIRAGWPDKPKGRRAFKDFDRWLREKGRGRNPGTTADLVAACLFAALRDGTIRLPLTPPLSS